MKWKMSYSILVIFLVCPIIIESISIVSGHNYRPHQVDMVWEEIEHEFTSSVTELRDVKFMNITHGWAVGENGTGIRGGIILNTQDGGNSWNLQKYNESQFFRQIEIIDGEIIWVTGSDGLFYSIDWGISWEYNAVDNQYSSMSTIKFINATHGWTATSGTLYRTINGGLDWQDVPGWTHDDTPREMHFKTHSEVWAIGFLGIYYSLDGCDTWTRVFDEGGWALSFADELEGWAVADSMLVHTTDGQTWLKQSLPTGSLLSSPYLTDVQFINSNSGWIVGGGSTTHVMYTQNGGQTWYEQSSPAGPTERLMAVDFFNETHGWAVGNDGIIIRTTKGDTLGTALVSPSTITMIVTLLTVGVVVVSISICFFITRNRKRIQSQYRRVAPHPTKNEDDVGPYPE